MPGLVGLLSAIILNTGAVSLSPEDWWIWYESEYQICTDNGGAVASAVNPQTGAEQPFCDMPKQVIASMN